MYSLITDVWSVLKGFMALTVYITIGCLGIVGIVYMLAHHFTPTSTVTTFDDQIRFVWETIRYRL
ncbi:hypothetical protein CF394_08820 [Tetzosporium hominis]|uniref:Uncharacterized protein n=1 Tax=Tetzosporium hominis TaxID=2020506 RepID=A0A264W2L9_9BACL|nr:hypothetical protein [Tetzosporium hominis]OZS77846.1 hypothetical protein CF394_08820 [Tetzosporium hominis]